MLFAVISTDKPGQEAVRASHRPDHLAWLKNHVVTIHVAGPLLTADGEGMAGSLLIVDAPDETTLRDELANDPYAKAGLFSDVRVERWKWTVGKPDHV